MKAQRQRRKSKRKRIFRGRKKKGERFCSKCGRPTAKKKGHCRICGRNMKSNFKSLKSVGAGKNIGIRGNHHVTWAA